MKRVLFILFSIAFVDAFAQHGGGISSFRTKCDSVLLQFDAITPLQDFTNKRGEFNEECEQLTSMFNFDVYQEIPLTNKSKPHYAKVYYQLHLLAEEGEARNKLFRQFIPTIFATQRNNISKVEAGEMAVDHGLVQQLATLTNSDWASMGLFVANGEFQKCVRKEYVLYTLLYKEGKGYMGIYAFFNKEDKDAAEGKFKEILRQVHFGD